LAQDAGELLLSLINNVLDVSKHNAGKLELDFRPTDVRTLVSRVAQMNKPSVLRKRLTLAVEISPTVPLLLSLDEVRLAQVLMNLVSNAIKFTEHGEVSVKVHWVADEASIPKDKIGCKPLKDYASPNEFVNAFEISTVCSADPKSLSFSDLSLSKLSRRDHQKPQHMTPPRLSRVSERSSSDELLCKYSYETQGFLEISVSDTGRGISTEMLPLLFKPFSQDKRAMMYGGTGLGLFISKTIVTALKGQLTVISEEGHGSQFIVNVPCTVAPWVSTFDATPSEGKTLDPLLLDSSVSEASPAAISSTDSLPSVGSLPHLGVMLVDNNKRWLMQNSEILSKQGFVVTSLSDIEEAVQLFMVTSSQCSDQETFNCLIVSCHSNEQNLSTIFASIRAHEARTEARRVPIYCLGSDLRKERVMSALTDCDGWLGQPLGDKQVSQLVSVLVQKEQRRHFSQSNTVLLVDDDRFTSDIIMSFVKKAHWDCIYAGTGQEALELYRTKSAMIRLVLCDCYLPDISGYEVSKAIRAFECKEKQPEVPIIAISGLSGEAHEVACREAGMTLVCKAYLVQKPFSYEVLRKTLASYSDSPMKHHSQLIQSLS
jgi:CheY-like chemotaxis protein